MSLKNWFLVPSSLKNYSYLQPHGSPSLCAAFNYLLFSLLFHCSPYIVFEFAEPSQVQFDWSWSWSHCHDKYYNLQLNPANSKMSLVMIVAYLHNPLQIDPNINCSMLRNHTFVWFNMRLHVLLLFGCLIYGNISTFGHLIYETCCHLSIMSSLTTLREKKTTTIITTKT